MEALTGEHSEEYQEAMGIEMQALQWAITWDIVTKNKYPGPPMFYP